MIKHGFQTIILWLFAATLVGCGDDPKIDATEPEKSMGDANHSNPAKGTALLVDKTKPDSPSVVDLPNANITPAEVIVTITEEAVIEGSPEVGEDDINEEPPDFPMLLSEANESPYTGSMTRVFPNGNREFSANYENGFLEGEARWWNSDGSLASSAQVKEGKILQWKTVAQVQDDRANAADTDAALAETIFVGTEDKLNEWSILSLEGEFECLLEEETGDKVSGGVKMHDENRRLVTHSEYKDGLLHGRKDDWYPNGVKSIESNYLNGEKHGTEIWRHENGGKQWEMNHVNGNQHGLSTEWDENGNITKQDLYENGELVEELQK